VMNAEVPNVHVEVGDVGKVSSNMAHANGFSPEWKY
jgi:hypothetical protein